jgi:hypothetical protein
MSRANEESQKKSNRLAAAWSNQILIKLCPGWPSPKPDKNGFDLIPKSVAVGQRIFSETADLGMGVNSWREG